MHNNYPSDELSFDSLKREMTGYTWDVFRKDAFAAITVAMLTLPQAMAAALLAGLPLSSGIFAAVYSSIIAAFFGSSRHLVVGPSNAIAILVQAGTAEILYNHYRDLSGIEKDMMAVQILTQLMFLTGFLQVLAAGFKLGRLTQFVSYSVVIGYIVGTALAMGTAQIYTLFGIPSLPGIHSLFERGAGLFTNWQQIHIPTAIVGIACLAILLFLKRLNKNIPGALILLFCAGVGVYILQLDTVSEFIDNLFASSTRQTIQGITLVEDTGEISSVFPKFELFFFNTSLVNELLPVAFAISLLSVMESTSVAKSIAACSGQTLSVNQEIFGLGMGNLFSAFTLGMPVSGSASRSNLNYSSGAVTRFASILNSIFVLLLVMCLGYFVTKIPLAAFAAILLITALNLVNFKQFLLCAKATSSDALVLWATIFSCIFFSLDMAFYIGVIVSVILYLKKAAVPQLVEFDFDETGELINLDLSTEHHQRNIRFIKVEGELFFGAAELFQSSMKSISEDDDQTKVIILQMKNARDIDATSCLALLQLKDYLHSLNRKLILCGITPSLWDVFCDAGIIQSLGRDNLFIFDERHPHQYMLKALERAYELAGSEKEPVIAPESVNNEIKPVETLA